ncbi:hypothetical protein P280DRAFT_467277 [Massarina eburnea CBS 473.64]|uniref:Uncharacterized protein n=1 Tax=Massarina eburnea CBS 473.64 TaxID=1395130 RepID=A0A6A6S651_9PLEO|nr:hypothetical protein P280DRAFT_467277 [Massarina eburnea CBS 473.64]
MTLPVDPTKAVFENIRKGLCSAILRLDQTETDRAIDLVKQFEDDEGTAKAHKAALAAKDELWEGFIEQKIRDVKAECEANINIIQTNNTPTTANDTTIRDLEAEHRATIDNMTRSYAQTIQAIKSECNEKIRTVETEKQMAAASEDAFHNLEAKHKAEIEEMQKEREEFQKMLLDNNDRLTEENIRLKTIADAVKADNIWDLHDSEDNDSEDNDSEDNDSEDNDSEDNDSEDNDSEDNDSDQDTNASVDEKENDTFTVDSYANNPANDQENKEPLGPVCVTVSESPSPFRDEPLEEYFDAGEAWNNRQLRYIDGPEVSPTAGRTSSVRKRAREEQDETATAAESPTRQKRHCVVAGTEASTPRRKLRFRGGSRK